MARNQEETRKNNGARAKGFERRVVIAVATGVLCALVFVPLLLSDGKPEYSEAWARCAQGDACVAVSIPCGWTGVNRRYREEAEAYYGYLATVIDLRCSIDEVPAEPPPASCQAGRCVLE